MGRVYLDAAEEARRRGGRRVGTDDVALAMLSDPDSEFAQALAVDLDEARGALQGLDRQALASLGIDVSSDDPALPARSNERLPLASAGRAVVTSVRRVAA